MNTPTTSSPPPRTLVVLAFAAIYLVWGSTYLAIRVVVETLPPFLSAGVRFLIAGGLLFAFLRARGVAKPARLEWRNAIVTGVLLLVGGNGLVVWAEQSISSGFAALVVALAPAWFALLDWLRPRGVRPRLKTAVGIVVGFLGVLILMNGRGGAHGNGHWWATLAVMVAGISWASGSLYSKHNSHSSSPWMTAAAQMICGGAGLLLVGGALGEPFRTHWTHVSARSLWALMYLIVFGSWIGFSAYIWLLKASTPSRVSTYAYVNPVIAVFLGWALLGESINAHMIWGALVILAGVIIITVPGAMIANGWMRVRQQVVR
ncbi:MAG TPA: EamA family transporter [Candidatus Limnocylindria bacterium]|nr:EamA family transporter [Candidatus Limnocylindria bacterium]